jgi:hypothetical protein
MMNVNELTTEITKPDYPDNRRRLVTGPSNPAVNPNRKSSRLADSAFSFFSRPGVSERGGEKEALDNK